MHLKITSLWWVVYEWDVSKVTIPTYIWQVTILPDHQPLTSVVKAWVVSFEPADTSPTSDLVEVDGKFHLSVSKWLMLVDWSTILITTSAATTSPQQSLDVLEQMKATMEQELAKIKEDGNATQLDLAVENMEKIQADIRLAKLR